jgi:hypothetical protein
MNKIILLFLLNLIFLGCVDKKKAFIMGDYPIVRNVIIKKLSDDLNLKFYEAQVIGIPSDEELVDFLIRNIAKKTLDNEKRYFFIVFPKEVSNYEGRVINTIEGFKENLNYVRSTNKFQCSKTLICPTLKIKVIFTMLKEKSIDYIVWDAKKILFN